MVGYSFITGHDIKSHAFGESRRVKCIKVPTNLVKDSMKYELGNEYTTQSIAPGSDNWDTWIVGINRAGDILDGFTFSKKELNEHFEFID